MLCCVSHKPPAGAALCDYVESLDGEPAALQAFAAELMDLLEALEATNPAARTRMAVECTSLTECLFAAESPAALYRGLRMTLSGALPFAALKLASYDLLRKRANHGRDATSADVP